VKPLVVLLAAFVIALLATYFAGDINVPLSGRIGMSVMLLFTSIGHFKFRKGMELMMPPFIPFKKELVWLTGLFEIAAAIGLLFDTTAKGTGIALVIFFMLILPANIYAAIKKVDFEKATYEGKGTGYLWFRVPLQVLFIAWVLYFAVL
jgi:uncharacterized membrane protein